MALPGGGDEYPPFRPSGGPYYPVKRRTTDAMDDDHHHHHHHSRHKRPRHAQHHPQFAGSVAFRAVDEPPLSFTTPLHHPLPLHRYPSPLHRYPSPLPHSPTPEPTAAAAPAMERTASGHSIRPDPTERSASTQLLEDMEAAQRVRDHLATFRRRNPDSKHERILRSIINPRPRRHHPHHRHRHPHHHHHHHHTRPHGSEPAAAEGEEYPLDNEALESIFSAANEIFFNGRLSQRVAWDWSHASAARFDSRVIGTTALRRAAATTRGFETLIVLSSTILRDAKYSRRLLISTFLHELIHCYLFICCGFRARCCGGHTDGFRDIAGVIEEWVGEGGGLYLSRIEADLELFRVGGPRDGGEGGGDERMEGERRDGRAANVYPCSGMAGEQEESVPAAAPSYGSRGVVHFVGDHADSCETGGGTPKVVYFGSGVAHASGTSNGTQEVVYFGRGVSPISRTSTPTREEVQYPEGRPAGGSGSRAMNRDSAWGRPRRALRPLYVYSGDETMAPYVYPNTMSQRP